jgi:predicted lactoylglutathione lyase
MKAYVEGMRSLLYYVGMLFDRAHIATDEKEKTRLQGMIDILIPVCKGYVTERAFEVCNLGLQVYGGYGYIREYPQEQLVRDCRITMIYEGTTGIQAMDLLGRKLGLNGGKPIMDLMVEMQGTLAKAKKQKALMPLAEQVETALNRLAHTAMQIGGDAASPKVMTAFAFANHFLDVCGDVVLSWMLLWRAAIADNALQNGQKKDRAFYEGQIKSAQYFIQSVLPVTLGKMDAINGGCAAAVEIDVDSFGGK